MRLIALKSHDYENKHVTAGEEYEATPQFADVLVRARVSRYADREMLPDVPPPGLVNERFGRISRTRKRTR